MHCMYVCIYAYIHTVGPLLRDHFRDRQEVVSQKRLSLMRGWGGGDLVWDICAFLPSKAGLTKKWSFKS